MALDTREKRMNAARVGRPWLRAKHAVGATDQQARIASGHGYGGNALSAGGFKVAWARGCNTVLRAGHGTL
jgi:hypothetical protein